jgi:hypothetical protein
MTNMSKRNQIQNALLTINPATFQLLGDAYFSKQNLGDIVAVGSVVGKDRTKQGTPDTLFITPEGRFIFVEYSVQSDGGYAKILGDLDKCLDEEKTGIALEKIDRIILCCTFQLSPQQINMIQEKGASRSCVVRVVGIDTLSWNLLQKYPDIAKEYLAVEVDTGQILDDLGFVTNYQRNGWAAPLDTEFFGRADELMASLEILAKENFVILSGKPGAGKSRLALECCRHFVKVNPDFEFRCILNNGLGIYEDLKAHLSSPGKYILLVDDANRLKELRQVLDLITDPAPNRTVKLVLTVRDYATNDILQRLPLNLRQSVVNIYNLGSEQIREIVQARFKINNPSYLERIEYIAQGNARLAIMAAKVAQENNLLSIQDASSLYDEYFSSVMKDLSRLSEGALLKTAALVALLRVVSKEPNEIFDSIATGLSIDKPQFWQDVESLYALEIVELHENEVAKLSDQVLATYLIYKVFFKENRLDIGEVIGPLLTYAPHRLTDALYPVASAFDSRLFADRLRPHVLRRWSQLQEADNQKTLLKLARAFYFLNPTATLRLVQDYLRKLPVADAQIPLSFVADKSRFENDPYLELIERVGRDDPAHASATVTLLFEFAVKSPPLIPQIMRLLLETFCFQKESHLRSYDVECLVIKELLTRLEGADQEICKDIFLGIVEHWLGFEFSSTWSTGRGTITWTRFGLAPGPEIYWIRKTLWNELFAVYAKNENRTKVLEILYSHAQKVRRNGIKAIILEDVTTVLSALENFDPAGLSECVVAHAYLSLTKQNGARVPEELLKRFDTHTYRLLRALDPERKRGHGDWQKEEQQRTTERRNYFAAYGLNDFKVLFAQIPQMSQAIGVNSAIIEFSPLHLLGDLASTDIKLFRKVVRSMMEDGNPLGLYWVDIAVCWVQTYKNARVAWNYLKSINFLQRHAWMFAWYMRRNTKVSHVTLAELLQLYREASIKEIPAAYNHVLPFRQLSPNVFSEIMLILLERSEIEGVHFDLEWFFPSYHEPLIELESLFPNNIQLVKRAYLHHVSGDFHHDAMGESLKHLLIQDPNFIEEYIDRMFQIYEEPGRRDDQRNYGFIWTLPNYAEIMTKIVLLIHEREQGIFILGDSYLNSFFIRHADRWPEEADSRIEAFLRNFIALNSRDAGLMLRIFELATSCRGENRFAMIKTFLHHNSNLEDFFQLPLEPNSWSWSGSAVPMHEKRINFLESILPLLEGLDFLGHRQRVEDLIASIRSNIERELKRDFTNSAF